MVQQEVTVNGVVAWVCWTLAACDVVAALVWPEVGLTPLAVLLVGAAAVLHVRGFVYAHEDRVQRLVELSSEAQRVRALR